MIDIQTTLRKFDSKLWGYHFPLPYDIITQLNSDHLRIVIKTNNFEKRSAIMSSKEYPFILVNQTFVKHNKLVLNAPIALQLSIDHSEYGMDIPVELSELLNQDPKASGYFDQLTEGKQRSLIYLVSKVKSSDSRLNKALAIADHLKTTKGALDFKALNERIKYYNNLK